jgi:probable O-glycosylation ligase (exosortase A-associated)
VGVRGILMAAFFLGSLPVCFFRPFYGLILWTIVAFVNPQAYIWGAGNLPWAQMVIIPTIAGTLIFARHEWSALKTRESLLIMALGVWFTITTVVSVNHPVFMHHASDTLDRWTQVSKILLVTMLTIPMVNSLQRLRNFVLVVSGCFGLFVLKTLPFIVMTGGGDRLYGPPDSMIADNNDFGLALNMTLPLFFFLAQSESRPWVKRFFGFLFIITIPAVLFTYSRGALIGLVVVGALMFLHLPMRSRLVLTPVILLGLALALWFAPDSWQKRMNSIGNFSTDGSAQGRLNAWQYALNLTADYPLTGGGFATFTRELYDRYSPKATSLVLTAHSVYFQVLADQGYVGLLLYLTLLGSAFLTASRLVKWAKLCGDEMVMHYGNMFRFSLVGFATSGAFLSRAYFDYFFTIVACIAILKYLAFKQWAHSADEENTAIEDEQGDGQLIPAREEAPGWS